MGRKGGEWKKRNKSLGIESNETNETECEDLGSPELEKLWRERMSSDVNDYCDEISIEANEYFYRRIEAFARIQYLMHVHFGTDIHIYGSCALGLAVKNSDIDIVVDESIAEHFRRMGYFTEQPNQILEAIAQLLSEKQWVQSIRLIGRAAIPLLKFTVDTGVAMREEGMGFEDECKVNFCWNKGPIEVDLSLQLRGAPMPHLGIASTVKMWEWLQGVEHLQQLVIILKHCLTERHLNDTYKGGLKTYSLMVLVMAYLRGARPAHATAIHEVLERLACFYANEFDEERTLIDLSSEAVFLSKDAHDQKSAALEIHDPLNPACVITKSCYMFSEVKGLFRDILLAFSKARNDLLRHGFSRPNYFHSLSLSLS